MKIKAILKKTIYNLVSGLLFINNFFFSRKLRVRYLIYSSKIINIGNETELNWNTIGCHKISIKNLATFPGNISHKSLKLVKKTNDIEITFFGISGQKQTKNITIESTSPSVLNTFSSETTLSNLSSVPLIREDLKKTLNDSFNYQVPKKIKLNRPKILSKELRLNFEPFIISNYPIKPEKYGKRLL